MGALAAVTRAEEGSAYFIEDSQSRSFRAEPRTEYGVVSAQQDMNGGASQVTGIVTALRRALPATGGFDDLPEQAYSGGIRFEHQWSDRTWRLSGHFAGSHIRGKPEALVRVQSASNHYFQRPDATRFRVDSAATSLTGADWRLQFDRQNSAWTGGIWLAEVTNGFEVNDFGFSRNRERIDTGFRVGYLQIQPGRVFRDYSVNFFTFANFSHEAFDAGSCDSWRRAYTNGTFNLQSRFTLLNYHGGNLDLSWRPDTYSPEATRGGPIMLQPGSLGARFGVSFDRRQPYSGNLNINISRGARDSGSEFSIGGNVGMRPAPPLQLEIEPSFSIQSDASQYVTSTSTLPYAPTFGRRYFFGDLERKTLSLETRVNYAFSPTLSLQVYAQGLLSSGDYVAYRQLAQAGGTFDFLIFEKGQAITTGSAITCSGGTICRDTEGDQHVDLNADGTPDFSFDDRDFNVRSLIGNAVLRWEYRPGSTVFFVWQLQQEGRVGIGDFDFGRDLNALWGVPADNRFIVKVNYWLGL